MVVCLSSAFPAAAGTRWQGWYNATVMGTCQGRLVYPSAFSFAEKIFSLDAFIHFPFLFSSFFRCSLPCLGVVLCTWEANATGCVHICPRTLGLRSADHRAEKEKCKDPAEWVEAPRDMVNLG